MDKSDAELTRMAIEEILRETKERNGSDGPPHSNKERKINPLGKTNKHFLGRTLNAIVRHNERAEDQNRRNCRKKLKELNRRRGRSRSSKRTANTYSHKSRKKRKTRADSSEPDDSPKRRKKRHSSSKRKKKQRCKKTKRRNSFSSSNSGHTYKTDSEERRPQQNYEVLNNVVSYDAANVDTQAYLENIGAWMMQPILWTAQMQQLYQYKALIDMSSNPVKPTETVQIEELSSSSSSLSDVNFEEVVESKPSLKIMLAINLSTDEDEDPNAIPNENLSIEVSDSDTDQLEEKNRIIEISDSDSDESSCKSQKTEASGSDILIGSDKDIISHISITSNSTVDLTDE